MNKIELEYDKFKKQVAILTHSLPNLSEMLTAVGIDINKDLNLQNALRQLVYHRGDYAHLSQNSKITKLLDKTALEDCVNDCLRLCEDIKIMAINKI